MASAGKRVYNEGQRLRPPAGSMGSPLVRGQESAITQKLIAFLTFLKSF
jgi:hypothetical protein